MLFQMELPFFSSSFNSLKNQQKLQISDILLRFFSKIDVLISINLKIQLIYLTNK